MAGEIASLVERARDPGAAIAERHEAFGELVSRFQDMAYGYAYGILQDSGWAEEAAQEALVSAYGHLGQLQDAEAFPGWLRTIVFSRCHRLLRDRRSAAEPLEVVRGLAAPRSDPSAMVEDHELGREVMGAVDRLPEHERVTTVLYYIDGYSQRQVADFLSVSLAAVKKRLQRARERLMEDLMDTLGQELSAQRPSKDERFRQEVQMALLMETAALNGQMAMLELLLVDGFDVNTRNSDGGTLLHWAAQKGHIEALELLLAQRADLQIADRSGRTALQVAVECGQRAAAELLRRAETTE